MKILEGTGLESWDVDAGVDVDADVDVDGTVLATDSRANNYSRGRNS
jgi:hypothetical protein